MSSVWYGDVYSVGTMDEKMSIYIYLLILCERHKSSTIQNPTPRPAARFSHAFGLGVGLS